MPGHHVAVKDERNSGQARAGYRRHRQRPNPAQPRVTLPQTSVHVASAPILNGLVFAAAILLVSLEAMASFE